jgi:hypothetical protein
MGAPFKIDAFDTGGLELSRHAGVGLLCSHKSERQAKAK